MRIFFVLFLLFFSQHSYNKIVEHTTINSVFNYLDTQETLVIFDIDNTVATSSLLIGSDQWFSYLIAQKQKDGLDIDHAINLVLPTYFHVAFKVPLLPVEPCTPFVIKTLSTQGIATLALTSRSIYIADRTHEQLTAIAISFDIPQVQKKEMFLTLPTHIPSMYKHGMLFSGNNNKGAVLIEFFKETNFYPKKVIFFDDKEKYLHMVEDALSQLGINFIGIRYGGCDEHVHNFDPIKAEQEYQEFKISL